MHFLNSSEGQLPKAYTAQGGWIDISLPIEAQSTAWHGLPGPRLEQLARIEDGAAVTVGQLDCCLHTGTHADAPSHVLAGAPSIEQMALDHFLGPARLIVSEDPERIGLPELAAMKLERRGARPWTERILIATPQQYDGRDFPARIPALDPEAVEYLVWLGTRLVGVNLPSIDPLESKDMLAHKLLFGAGAGLLENLALTALSPSNYELVAAPIAVVGGDAAPVRALLRRV